MGVLQEDPNDEITEYFILRQEEFDREEKREDELEEQVEQFIEQLRNGEEI